LDSKKKALEGAQGMPSRNPFPIPNFDWSHLPLGWYEFIGGEANQETKKPLRTDEYGAIDAEYYGSFPCWPIPMALDILDSMNWGRGLGIEEQIRESVRLSYTGREGWLMISLFPEKDENGCSLVNAFLFCNWADNKGFNINRVMREVQIGFDNNRHPRKEELVKMLRLHLSYQERLRKKALQEQEEQPTVKAEEPAKIRVQEKVEKEKGLKFYKTGKTWCFGFNEIKNVPDTKGMRYLQYLFLNPNVFYSGLEIRALDGVEASSIIKKQKDTCGLNEDDPHQREDEINLIESGGQKFSLKRELLELKEECEKAEEQNLPEAGILRKEYEETLTLNQSLHDRHGKPRDDTAPQNRAIKAVAKNIKTSKDNILEYCPELDELLKDIKTGNQFGYFPSNPDNPVKIITQ
jgi:hypothetical protein